MRVRELLCASLLVSFLAVNVWADDFFPPTMVPPGSTVPTWLRTDPLATSQEWGFGTSANPITPDGAVPLREGDYAGAPFTGGVHTHAEIAGLTWSNLSDPDGRWNNTNAIGGADGTITLFIRDWVDLQPLKHLRLQVSYDHPVNNEVLPVALEGTKNGLPATTDFVYEVSGNQNSFNPILSTSDQHYRFQYWTLRPNPDWEKIIITVPPQYSIDQIVVDTISIPEPATMGVLGVGISALFLRRRRA